MKIIEVNNIKNSIRLLYFFSIKENDYYLIVYHFELTPFQNFLLNIPLITLKQKGESLK